MVHCKTIFRFVPSSSRGEEKKAGFFGWLAKRIYQLNILIIVHEKNKLETKLTH